MQNHSNIKNTCHMTKHDKARTNRETYFCGRTSKTQTHLKNRLRVKHDTVDAADLLEKHVGQIKKEGSPDGAISDKLCPFRLLKARASAIVKFA